MSHAHITIGCVGMTHLGLIHAAAFAKQGFNVICFDGNPELIQQLKADQLPVNEPQLDDIVTQCASRLTFTHELHLLTQSSVVFIACDVPTDGKGNSDLTIIKQLIEQVTPILSEEVCLVVLSQVPPGFTRNIAIAKHRLFYQVETLVFGQAIARALYPERYIIGTSDPHKPLPDDYLTLLSSFDCPILPMQYESAELAKISINMFLVSSVTTTNTIAEICEQIGANWDEIAPALRLDKRIGQHAYLTPGLGLSGGNLERDLNTIIKLGHENTTDVGTVEAWLYNSEYRKDWVYRCLRHSILNQLNNPSICILGLAYKPDTHSTKNSPSIALIRKLKKYRIKAHDPIVHHASFEHVTHVNKCIDAIKEADIVIIMTPWTEYKQLSCDLLKQHMRGNVVIDPYRVLQGDSAHLHFNYFSLGQASAQDKKKELVHA